MSKISEFLKNTIDKLNLFEEREYFEDMSNKEIANTISGETGLNERQIEEEYSKADDIVRKLEKAQSRLSCREKNNGEQLNTKARVNQPIQEEIQKPKRAIKEKDDEDRTY